MIDLSAILQSKLAIAGGVIVAIFAIFAAWLAISDLYDSKAELIVGTPECMLYRVSKTPGGSSAREAGASIQSSKDNCEVYLIFQGSVTKPPDIYPH